MSPVGSVGMWKILLFHSKSRLQVFEEGSNRKSELIKDISLLQNTLKSQHLKACRSIHSHDSCGALGWPGLRFFSSPVTGGSLVFLYCCSDGIVESQWSTTSIWVLQVAPVPWSRGQRDSRTQVTVPPHPQLCQQLAQELILGVHERMGTTRAESWSNCTEFKNRFWQSRPFQLLLPCHNPHDTQFTEGQWSTVLRKENQGCI